MREQAKTGQKTKRNTYTILRLGRYMARYRLLL